MISNPKITMENYKKVSFEILEEQQSEDFLELQNKFDKLVLNTLMRLYNSEFLPKDYVLNNFIKT